MTKAEREMVLSLMHDGGCDYCQKCIHCNKESCGAYVAPKDFSGECSDDYCIDGMIEYFEEQQVNQKTGEKNERKKRIHST